jgi:hypothetical protein
MADFDKISQQVGEVAGRVADVADAAQGKRSKGGGGGRWLLLPAAGAVVYAAVKSWPDLARKAKDLGRQAGEKAPELLDVDLVGRVKEATGLGEDGREVNSRRSSSQDQDDFEKNRNERAERRERRREATSA